jgi:hypothetical protein
MPVTLSEAKGLSRFHEDEHMEIRRFFASLRMTTFEKGFQISHYPEGDGPAEPRFAERITSQYGQRMLGTRWAR